MILYQGGGSTGNQNVEWPIIDHVGNYISNNPAAITAPGWHAIQKGAQYVAPYAQQAADWVKNKWQAHQNQIKIDSARERQANPHSNEPIQWGFGLETGSPAWSPPQNPGSPGAYPVRQPNITPMHSVGLREQPPITPMQSAGRRASVVSDADLREKARYWTMDARRYGTQPHAMPAAGTPSIMGGAKTFQSVQNRR